MSDHRPHPLLPRRPPIYPRGLPELHQVPQTCYLLASYVLQTGEVVMVFFWRNYNGELVVMYTLLHHFAYLNAMP